MKEELHYLFTLTSKKAEKMTKFNLEKVTKDNFSTISKPHAYLVRP